MKKKVVMDACSAILLAKASVLQSLAEYLPVVATHEVYREVVQGKKKMFIDALLVEKLVKENKLALESGSRDMVKKIMADFNMEEGEASVIALSLKESWIVMTDNRQGRKAAKIFNLPLVGSVEIVVALFKEKKIGKEKAENALKILEDEGWFQPYIIDKAMGDLK